ncbi:MAG: PHP domain-containing protein [Dehalococcoidia bacterium]|nr:MAG: PHP domain-containing protein [Dehalococcoidia bacterium]
MKYDLHIHSKYSSDGVLEPEDIIKAAKERGMDGIAVTDHDTIIGGLETKKYETKDFKVIIGSEIMTEQGEVTGLFLSQEITSRDVQGVFSEIKAQGGIVVIPHPFDGLRRSTFHPTEEDVKFIDAIEGFNSRCVFQKYNNKAVTFALRYNLPIIGGSDAHFVNEIGIAGIVVMTSDIKAAILNNALDIFGKRSSMLNHARTRLLKTRIKVRHRFNT